MRIAVLGPLEVRDDGGAPVEIPGAKERLLLAVLAADAGRVVSTDRITEVLWNGDAPPSARRSLQAHVVRLRTALEPGRPRGSTGRFVARRGTGYALAVEREDLDALRFAELTALGRAHLGSGDIEQAVRVLTEAGQLWRGDPFADWPDADFATAERRRLTEVRAGAVGALLEARLAAGDHATAVPELERLVLEEPLREDWWRLLVLALYRSGRQADALAAVRRARGVLADELGADPGPALREVEAAVLAQDPALDVPRRSAFVPRPAAPQVASGRCPYMGLAAYQPSDAGLFHGRRRLVDQLVARLVDQPFLVVSGPSGAGKSSAVRAGLLPALASGAIGSSATWRPVVLTPGRTPVDALSPLTGEDLPDEPVLLVCDQLEELWAPGVDESERRTFLDTVLGLLDDGIVARWIAVVRGDHVGRLAEHGGVVERLAEALVLVPPLSDPELREVVREPATAVGLTVEPELLDTVVADVLGRAGALPLLSAALVGTWERRRGSALTLAGYLEAGGVSGALMRSAEAAYESLDSRGRDAAHRLLIRLADVDEQGGLVRRRVPLAHLGSDDDAVRQVVETFVARRLLSVDGESVEVTHEALLTAWPRLARWLDDDGTGRAVRRHLDPAAHDWAAAGRPDDELYRGARLAAALDWAATADAYLTPLERQFLTVSRARVDADLTAARSRADREASGRRRTRRLAAGLAAVLVAALVAGGAALRAADVARRTSVRADADRLANLAATTGFTDLSLLLAVQAHRLIDLPETRSALLGALLDHGRAEHVAALPEPGSRLALGPHSTVLVETGDGGIYRWIPGESGPRRLPGPDATWFFGRMDSDGSSREALLAGVGRTTFRAPWLGLRSADGDVQTLVSGPLMGGAPLAVAFSDDGSAVVVVLAHGEAFETGEKGPPTWSLATFDLRDGSRRDVAIGGPLDRSGLPSGVDIGDDARTAVVTATGPGGSTEVLADVTRGTQVPLRTPVKAAASTGIRALPAGAAELWSDGEVTLYGLDGRIRQRLNAASGPVEDVVLAPDGTWAASVGSGGQITLWDVDASSGSWIAREHFVGHEGDVIDAEVEADSGHLVTLGQDARVVVWDARPEAGFGTALLGLGGQDTVGPPQVVDPGRLLVAPTVSTKLTVAPGDAPIVRATFFRPSTGEIVDTLAIGEAAGDSRGPPAVSVSPDRRQVAVSTGATVAVLDAETHRVLTRYTPPPVGVATGHPAVAAIGCLAWTTAPSRLLVCSDDEDEYYVLAAVDPTSGRRVAGTAVGVPLHGMAMSRDGRLLAAGSGPDVETGLAVFDARSLELVRYVSLNRGVQATSVSFSPDGRWIALTGPDGLVVVDTTTWEATPSPAPLSGDVLQAEWFSDGHTLAVAGRDSTVFLYDIQDGHVSTLPLPGSGRGSHGEVRLVPGIADELIVLGAGDQGGRRYPLDVGAWAARACSVAGRDLTREEWSRYLPDRPYEPICSGPD